MQTDSTVALSVDEAADAMGVGKTTFYALMRSGKIKFAKIGRRTIIPKGEPARVLAELLAEQTKEAA